jgi:hypothetical protein
MKLKVNKACSILISIVITAGFALICSACGPQPLDKTRQLDGSAEAYLRLMYPDAVYPDGLVPELPDDPDEEGEPDLFDVPFLISQFQEPNLTAEQLRSVLELYTRVDKENSIPKALREKAIAFYHVNLAQIPNKKRISIIDYSRHSKQKRMWIVNMDTGAVWAMHVAHGKGSDDNHDGYADKFSNQDRSNATSLGFYLTGEPYRGKWGLSMYLDGLSATNSNARARKIVLHGAPYVREADVRQGRSWGCPAVAMENRNRVVEILSGGSVMLAGYPAPAKYKKRVSN